MSTSVTSVDLLALLGDLDALRDTLDSDGRAAPGVQLRVEDDLPEIRAPLST